MHAVKQRPFLQLDVFASRPGAGNPLAVVFDADDLDGAAMQAFANWTNLSETIFLLRPSAGASYHVRIFTPHRELAFAGHPSVGAAWSALDAGLASGAELVQECKAGLLPVRVDGSGDGRVVSVRAPRSMMTPANARTLAQLEEALPGVRLGDMVPALWDNGAPWWIAELADEAEVRGMRPDLPAITAFTQGSAVGVAVFARSEAAGIDLVLRAFCPGDGIPEDPVTGSANASVAHALLAEGRIQPGQAYVASQGREVGRDGLVQVQVDDEGEVWIGGQVQAVVRGQVRV